MDVNLNTTDTRKGEKGVTTVEYAVMLVLVAISVIAFGGALSTAVKGVFQQIVNAL